VEAEASNDMISVLSIETRGVAVEVSDGRLWNSLVAIGRTTERNRRDPLSPSCSLYIHVSGRDPGELVQPLTPLDFL
jgi:hypothetical protein